MDSIEKEEHVYGLPKTGLVWVCLQCGRYSLDLYGLTAAQAGWDSTCVRSAIQVPRDSVELGESGLVVGIKYEDIINLQKLRSN